MTRNGGSFVFVNTMKSYCGKCEFFKFEDADGLGWCSLWEESDVSREDEACVEYQEDEVDYE